MIIMDDYSGGTPMTSEFHGISETSISFFVFAACGDPCLVHRLIDR